jgi:hypothetical protein
MPGTISIVLSRYPEIEELLFKQYKYFLCNKDQEFARPIGIFLNILLVNGDVTLFFIFMDIIKKGKKISITIGT